MPETLIPPKTGWHLVSVHRKDGREILRYRALAKDPFVVERALLQGLARELEAHFFWQREVIPGEFELTLLVGKTRHRMEGPLESETGSSSSSGCSRPSPTSRPSRRGHKGRSRPWWKKSSARS